MASEHEHAGHSQDWRDGRRNGIKLAVSWLRDEALKMNDPAAKTVLNNASFHFGVFAKAIRPAPSQIDEERAQSIIEDVWDNVDGESAKQVLIRALAEATLAGAAAEKEASAKVADSLLVEQRCDGDECFDESAGTHGRRIAAAIRASK